MRCTLVGVDRHATKNWPYNIRLQRYIVGRPNLLRLNIYPVMEDQSPYFMEGGDLQFHIHHLDVWCYADKYIPRLEVDCQQMSPSFKIAIGMRARRACRRRREDAA